MLHMAVDHCHAFAYIALALFSLFKFWAFNFIQVFVSIHTWLDARGTIELNQGPGTMKPNIDSSA
uniref:Uncharacterized protein n=1 Tax=Rhizophora mucronata TaxID=61149 RepID=A0A2P2K6U9_RHIMU